MPHHHQLCSKIQNAFQARLRRIAVPETNQYRAICRILYDEGFLTSMSTGDVHGPYLRGHEVPVTPDNVSQRRIWLDLKYRDGEPVLTKMQVISKPSRKVYATNLELKAIASARRARTNSLLKATILGQITILNTPYGVIDMKEALKKDVGGEVLCIAF